MYVHVFPFVPNKCCSTNLYFEFKGLQTSCINVAALIKCKCRNRSPDHTNDCVGYSTNCTSLLLVWGGLHNQNIVVIIFLN